MTIKGPKYVKIYSVNVLYLIFNKVNGYFEEISAKKYVTLIPANESKEKKNMKNMSKIRDLNSSMTKKPDDYDENYNSNNELLLNKTIEIPSMTIVVRDIFRESNKYYPKVFLEEYLYEM